MKKLLYIYIIGVALAMVGCTKDADIEIDSTNTPASFTLAELTRGAAEVKTDWELGDKVAIFEEGDLLNAKCYEVSDLTDRTLIPSDEDDFFFANNNNEYSAFYPYVAGRIYSEYLDDMFNDFDSTDRLSSGDFAEGTALTFSHRYALLSFNISLSDPNITNVTASLTLGDSVIEDVAATTSEHTATLNLFVTPLDATEYSAMTPKILSVTGKIGSETTTSRFDLNTNSEITQFEAGVRYNYNDMILGDFDIYYTDGVYQIYTAKGLQAFADLVNGAVNTKDATCGGDGFAVFEYGTCYNTINGKLMADINLSSICGSGDSWIPIGNDISYRYQGIFDGNGKKISNLYINGNSYAGLFNFLSGATIKNLGVAGSVTTTSSNAGGIAVQASSASTIINCYNECTVTSNGTEGTVGGIVGDFEGTMTNCYNTGAIKTGSDSWLGGIVGYLNSNSSINNCYNTGKVTGTDQYIASIAGYVSYGNIDNCYYLEGTASQGVNSNSTGTTTEMTAAEMQGYTLLKTLRDNAATYNATDATEKACGWVAGASSPTLDFGVEPMTYDIELINNLYYISSGTGMAAFSDLVNGKGNTQSATYSGFSFTGVPQLNIDGLLRADITLGGFTTISTETNKYNGEFEGGGHTISGVSVALFDYLDSRGVIANLTTEGEVSSQSDYVGAIVAWNSGSVINCCNKCSVEGVSRAGGIAGYNNGEIINCSNRGTIVGADTLGGGIVSKNEGYVTNCYSDTIELIGSGTDPSNSYNKTAAQDKETELNTTAAAYNSTLSADAPYKACMWSAGADSYPIHDFGTYELAND